MLARRPLLSCFHEVYAFVRNEDDVAVRRLPKGVIAELCLLSTLLFSLVVDLRADWTLMLGATDGAENFGNAGCWAKVTPEAARRVATVGSVFEKRILPSDVVGADADGPFNCVLPCARSDFKTTFSIKSDHGFHASKLEIGAFSLSLALRAAQSCC